MDGTGRWVNASNARLADPSTPPHTPPTLTHPPTHLLLRTVAVKRTMRWYGRGFSMAK